MSPPGGGGDWERVVLSSLAILCPRRRDARLFMFLSHQNDHANHTMRHARRTQAILSFAMNSYSTWSTCSATTSYCSCDIELDCSRFRRRGRTKVGGSLPSFSPIMPDRAVFSAPPPRTLLYPRLIVILQHDELHIHHLLPNRSTSSEQRARRNKRWRWEEAEFGIRGWVRRHFAVLRAPPVLHTRSPVRRESSERSDHCQLLVCVHAPPSASLL